MASPSFTGLESFLDSEWRATTVLPPKKQLFAALELTPPEAVRVVVLGQDPYPKAGQANGLAFSVSRGMELPTSLKNLFLGLNHELGAPIPTHGDLTAWALRGVLLLNTALTVREGQPKSHASKGWEDFVLAVLHHVASRRQPPVFLCLGKPAQKLVSSLCIRCPRVDAPHPSKFNGSAFVQLASSGGVFTQINKALGTSVDWSF